MSFTYSASAPSASMDMSPFAAITVCKSLSQWDRQAVDARYGETLELQNELTELRIGEAWKIALPMKKALLEPGRCTACSTLAAASLVCPKLRARPVQSAFA